MTEDTSGGGETQNDAAAERAAAASVERVDDLAADLRAAGDPFALVTVVRREPPVPANVGDRAVVTPDGDLVGWVGGAACAQSVAVKEALSAIESGEPRLVGLAPDPADVEREGLTAYPMTCHSGGTLELFVEPVVPTPRLVVVGESPIALALARLASETSFDVTVVAADADGEFAGADDVVAVDDPALADAVAGAAAVVVASTGEYDTEGVAAALAAGAPYVGLVSSRKRRDAVAEEVADRLGTDAESVVDAVTTPAGLDIGAETPAEIAVSVLAELVAVRRGASDRTATDAIDVEVVDDLSDDEERDDAAQADEETAVDPVCGMTVDVADAAATADHGGETYHFCGQGCADAFADDPERYLDGVVEGG
ncbi:XdhC family protein [Halobacterium litoreum]|uniref:XdhC family protein n=1 Tax=Halobacterium litoreum TaxID=2039234 RepID=A0ABD5NEI6_9EURY|nr:XdhC family protein [Halobacterium litoreum]UHH13452.1 XdhC family protein [Halobacterium litoreum]